MSYETFLVDTVKLSEEEYIKCIRSSLQGPKVFLKRRPSEIRVNLYNKNLLRAWNANLDIQFVLDPYACAMYIVSYISKSQRGMSALLDRACKEARQGNMDIKRQVRHIGNQFLNSVEVSAQEACYLVLQMPLTKASREVLFINTSPPDERVFLLKQQAKLEELASDSTDIQCGNLIQRYAQRPSALQNWCLADYASQLYIKYPDKLEDEETQEVNDDDINQNDSDDDLEKNPNSDAEFSSSETLLTLKNGIVIKRRRNDRILRYVHYSRKSDPENHFREKLMLFLPWKNEHTDLLGGCDSYEAHYKKISHVIENRVSRYEHHTDELEEAMLAAEEDHNAQYDELAPNAQQANADDEAEGQQETDEFIHFNPDRPTQHRQCDIGSEIGVVSGSSIISENPSRLPDDQYNKLVRNLNDKQREFFFHVLHVMKTTTDPMHVFLSGGAGVGKSVLIKALYQALHRHLHSTEGEDPDDIRILLCAFTGKAAFNINGVTIASAFHKKYNQSNQSMSSDELNTFRMRYRNLQVVIIDEISMVGNKMLNFIDTRLKELTSTNRPFGGISIIAVGDLFQLQPVCDSWIFSDLSHGVQPLATNLWKEHFTMFELTEIMRQKDDLHFANLLNRLRTNDLTGADKIEIALHSISPFHENYPKSAPHLFIENKFVDDFNDKFIAALTGAKIIVESHDTVVSDLPKNTKERLIQSLPTDANKTANLSKTLTVTVDMIYDITINLNVADGIANGSTCVVKCVECRMKETTRPSIVWVLFSDAAIGTATRQKYRHLYHDNIDQTWTPIFEVSRNFLYNRKSFQRSNFPLKPAAAKTVHKSQGCTVDEVVVDLSQTNTKKVPHIHYVALSRVRKLENLYITNFNEEALSVDGRVIEEMGRLRNECKVSLSYVPLYSTDGEDLKIVLNNARSLHKHFVDVRSEPNVIAADVIGITESRLVASDVDADYHIEGYKMVRLDQTRTNTNSRPPHGLVMYVKDEQACECIPLYTSKVQECLLCRLHLTTMGDIQIVLLYSSPSCELNDFKNMINAHIKPNVNKERPLLIMGDFNFDIFKQNASLLQFMNEMFSCRQLVQKSTTDYGSCLDLMFSNCQNMYSDVIECYWSDHKLVYGCLPTHE